MHNRLILAFLSLLLTGLAACGENTSSHDAPAQPPPGARAPADPPAAPPQAAPAPAGAKLALSGTIAYEGTPHGTVLFISVKDPARPGPPLAAKKLPPGPFPMNFTLTDADIMQMGPTPREIPATVTLSVTLDADGNAMTKDPSDPKATLETPAEKSDLAITLTAGP